MSFVERLVASLTAIITLAAGVTGLALVSGWNGTPWLFDLVVAARGPARLELGLAALLLVGLALYLLLQVWQRERPPDSLRQTTQLGDVRDRKSTRLNSSHVKISYAVFCLKKKTTK